jgi:phage regulator Rha-like protein
MSNINISIQTVQDTLVVDSRLVADELGILHRNFKELIKTYIADFEEFGNLSATSVGVNGTSSYAEFYYLNENQAYLSLTYSNNTPQVRRAKINLVKAFDEAREASRPQAPKTLIEAMEVALTALKEVEATKLLLAESENKVIEMFPKVEIYNTVCEQGENLKIGAVSKILSVENMGPNKLFSFLRDKEILRGNNEPYARYEFQYKYFTCIRGVKNNISYITPLVTPKGIEFIIRLLTKHGYYVPSKLAAA